MGKFTVGNGQYVIYAKDSGQARQVISQELQRVDKIREKTVSYTHLTLPTNSLV